MDVTDVDALLDIFADPKVIASFGIPPFNRQQMEQWVKSNIDHQSKYGYGLFSVILKSNGLLIGDCGLEHMNIRGEKAVELGYDFRSDCWHHGYATEAPKAFRDFAFEQLGRSKIVSLIRVGNDPSRRVAERVGMRFVSEVSRFNNVRYWVYEVTSPAPQRDGHLRIECRQIAIPIRLYRLPHSSLYPSKDRIESSCGRDLKAILDSVLWTLAISFSSSLKMPSQSV
jgi:RimJ/RimL family protein N-acetyltransferase